MPAGTPGQGCYETGRDGFWIHRYLVSRSIANSIVDSSSIEVNRRRRRTKTDRLDVGRLLTMLRRAAGGEKKVWSVVNVPTSDAENHRQVHLELLLARRDRGRHTNLISNARERHALAGEQAFDHFPLGGFAKLGCSTSVDTDRRLFTGIIARNGWMKRPVGRWNGSTGLKGRNAVLLLTPAITFLVGT